MDDPTRTPVVDDLQASTGLDIEVITSTTASIWRALEQMYPTPAAPGAANTSTFFTHCFGRASRRKLRASEGRRPVSGASAPGVGAGRWEATDIARQRTCGSPLRFGA